MRRLLRPPLEPPPPGMAADGAADISAEPGGTLRRRVPPGSAGGPSLAGACYCAERSRASSGAAAERAAEQRSSGAAEQRSSGAAEQRSSGHGRNGRAARRSRARSPSRSACGSAAAAGAAGGAWVAATHTHAEQAACCRIGGRWAMGGRGGRAACKRSGGCTRSARKTHPALGEEQPDGLGTGCEAADSCTVWRIRPMVW